MKFKYKITKFDKENNLLSVVFDDGGWADIGLRNPLPKNIKELESIIKQFTAPKETIEARVSPDADLSYIEEIIGIEKESDRFSLINPDPELPPELSEESQKNLEMWEDINFQKKVGDALVSMGIIQSNPSIIPVTK